MWACSVLKCCVFKYRSVGVRVGTRRLCSRTRRTRRANGASFCCRVLLLVWRCSLNLVSVSASLPSQHNARHEPSPLLHVQTTRHLTHNTHTHMRAPKHTHTLARIRSYITNSVSSKMGSVVRRRLLAQVRFARAANAALLPQTTPRRHEMAEAQRAVGGWAAQPQDRTKTLAKTWHTHRLPQQLPLACTNAGPWRAHHVLNCATRLSAAPRDLPPAWRGVCPRWMRRRRRRRTRRPATYGAGQGQTRRCS